MSGSNPEQLRTSESGLSIPTESGKGRQRLKYWLDGAAVFLTIVAVGVSGSADALQAGHGLVDPPSAMVGVRALELGLGISLTVFLAPVMAYSQIRFGTWFGKN